jgi:predicted O-methyltransferase YrrM
MFFRSRTRRKYAEAAHAYAAVPAEHKEFSVIASPEPRPPSPRLLDLALAAAAKARATRFQTFAGRASQEARWFETWPGEHYKLLAGLVGALGAKRIVEVGTFTGMSALAMLEALPADGQLTTFDLKPWREIANTWLTEGDFASGRLAQEIADISAPGAIARYRELFEAADFLFFDGPKDGVTEPKFLAALASLELPRNPVVMFDDIRVLNMVALWRAIDRPKLDLTSFGHWSGTGLVDWNG